MNLIKTKAVKRIASSVLFAVLLGSAAPVALAQDANTG